MRHSDDKPALKGFALIALTGALVVALILALLGWSSIQVDRVQRNRDIDLAMQLIAQGTERVGHTQESSTVWDAAVLKLRERPLDYEWLDVNLGTWFKEYAGQDEVYILDKDNHPIYAMHDGRRATPELFASVKNQVEPLVRKLRAENKPQSSKENQLPMLAPGVADLLLLNGKPAIVSAKPVITDTGALVQKPGTEAVHISVVLLTDAYLKRAGKQFGLSNVRFVPKDHAGSSSPLLAVRSNNGATLGYLEWEQFRPGRQVASLIGPIIGAALLLAALIVLLLTQRLRRQSLELHLSNAKSRHLALHDPLTGLPNRSQFETQLQIELSRAKRSKSQLALVYLDLDSFKHVNDTLGHAAGDQLLREVAQRIRAELRPYDSVARLGGDEFAIILTNPRDHLELAAICNRIIECLREPIDVLGNNMFVGASLGVARYPLDAENPEELIRKADIALYQAKADGRGRFVPFHFELEQRIQTRETILRELREAVANCDEHFELLYQPIFAVDAGRIAAVEALLRWKHPERGLLSPAIFMATAEESGLIRMIGSWVIARALRDVTQWPELRVAINVSPKQVRDPDFCDEVVQLLSDANVAPQRVEIEITETALLDTSLDVKRNLANLRGCGFKIALDDFGTGYSSLSHIRDLAVDRIKIDRSFVQSAHDEGNGASLLEAIIALGRANKLALTGEGVETQTQRDLLISLGCDELQGHLLSLPLAADAISLLLRAQSNSRSLPARRAA